MTNRREMLRAAAAAPLGLLALPRGRAEAAPAIAPPPYTISINIEIMFNTGRGNPPMPRADRIRAVAAKGFKAYSFWNAMPDERKAMIKAQQESGLTCVSLVGTGSAGGTTSGGAGIMSGAPETVEIVTRSPFRIVASGASRASKKPQWTVSGVGSRWIGIEKSSCSRI